MRRDSGSPVILCDMVFVRRLCLSESKFSAQCTGVRYSEAQQQFDAAAAAPSSGDRSCRLCDIAFRVPLCIDVARA